jgi:hypothetical protein
LLSGFDNVGFSDDVSGSSLASRNCLDCVIGISASVDGGKCHEF